MLAKGEEESGAGAEVRPWSYYVGSPSSCPCAKTAREAGTYWKYVDQRVRKILRQSVGALHLHYPQHHQNHCHSQHDVRSSA